MRTTTLMLCMFSLLVLSIKTKAQTVNQASTLLWQFNLGTSGQTANYSTGTSAYFSLDWVDKGSNLNYKDAVIKFNDTLTRFQPLVASTNVDSTSANLVSFNVRPVTGLSFKPTSISFDCARYGTSGGLIKVAWKSPDGTITRLVSNISPVRYDNDATLTAFTHVTVNVSSLTIPFSTGDCALYFYIYNLGNTKQVGIGNIVINGNIAGSIVPTTKYTFNIAASPSAGGTVLSNPVGTSFDEGTSLTLTATRNFGYNFSHWTNDAGDTISKNSSYTFIILKNTSLYAVFKPINTYSLTLNTQGGAQAYMISVTPTGTTVNGHTMYEEGTAISLTANNNPLLTFNNWLTGETNPVLPLQMSKDQSVTAVYSAIDYIVGWDFYNSGGSSRSADFYSTADNQTATLILRKADGTISSWLDKSTVAANGYEGNRAAALNWKPVADLYYFQISFTAKDFTDIKVSAGLLYNYNAYTTQFCEYSLNGTDFTRLGSYTMPVVKTWYDNTFTLPADANHADKIYVRWIEDPSSTLNGTTAANNDGTAISNIYITANAVINNDGIAPVLIGSVPSVNSTNASATGKVVLTFDEKVMIAAGSSGLATLGSSQLTPSVSGKTIVFPYTGLAYSTPYTFTLPANSVSDLAGNTLLTSTTVTFTTMTRPTVTKKLFDFVVGVDGDFKAALTAATTASTSGERFRIFFPKGEYNIGPLTGDANQKTNISLSNISLIGEKDSSVVLYNKPTTEGIGVTATLAFTSTANNIYLQDMTLLNKLDYRTGTFTGRAAALQDQGSKNIYKNALLLSDQDTYYSGSGRTYFEGGCIHGTVDFICGGGDVFFNECLLYIENRTGNNITAPSTTSSWGYVFSNCKIDGYATANGNFTLGRPWQNSPRSAYINTKMNIIPSASGWTEMSVVPALFAEYNSTSLDGTPIDISNRKSTYTSTNTYVNPVLSKAEADQYTIENVLGGSDAWEPKLYTEQAPIPKITLNGSTINWDDSNYVLCWAIFKNGSFVNFVATNSYSIPLGGTNATYIVRAANEMGGLSANSNAVTVASKFATTITWNTPQPITPGTPLSETQLNAKANGTTSTATYSPSLGTILPAGTQTLTVTFSEDANYESATMSVTIEVTTTVSVKTLTDANISVYPNPVNDIVNVTVPKLQETYTLIITNNIGKVILSKLLTSECTEINLKDFQTGIYLFQISSKNSKTVKQIVKQ